MIVLRQIHPIGQGAFYTEELHGKVGHNANIVFDCGATKTNEKNLLCQQAYEWQYQNDIDLLFISHFDDDHVSGIKTLQRYHKISRVVIPQILGYEWYWFLEDASMSKAGGKGYQINEKLFDGLRILINDPNVKIIEIAPIGNEPNENDNLYQVRRRIDEGANNQNGFPIRPSRSVGVRSGDPIYPTDLKAWEYMPFNYTMGKDIDDLKKRVNNVLKKELMKMNCSSIEEVPYKQLINVLKDYFPQLNKVYRSVFDNSNKSSLCVYSGYTERIDHSCYIIVAHGKPIFNGAVNFMKEACLYTGDSILLRNKKLILMLSTLSDRDRLSHIGTLQLPHHGAHGNFGEAALNYMISQGCSPIVFFASYGHGNRNRHPSAKLINMLKKRGLIVCEVNEKSRSELSEYIEM